MHHVHISAFSLLIICLFLFGMTALLISFFRRPKPAPHYYGDNWRQDELDARAARRQAEMDQHDDDVRAYARSGAFAGGYRPIAPAPIYYGNPNAGADMLTGVLIGEAISGGFGHHDTIINETIVTGQGVGMMTADEGGITIDSVDDYSASDTGGIDMSFD